MQMTKAELLKVLRVAVGFLQDNVDAEISAQRIITLIGVAEHPGVAQYELGERIGIDAASTLSRNLNDLTHRTSRRKPGPGLVTQEPDPDFRRRNVVRLSDRGEALLAAMTAEVNKAMQKRPVVALSG